MDDLATFAVVVGGIAALVAWLRARARVRDEATREGHLRHLRAGAYPATCSWCRRTSTAHKLIVFERTDGWEPRDAAVLMARAPDAAVPDLVRELFAATSARWRRFCCEKCVREFFASDHLELRAPFAACAYCSTRFPMVQVRCPQCGGPRSG